MWSDEGVGSGKKSSWEVKREMNTEMTTTTTTTSPEVSTMESKQPKQPQHQTIQLGRERSLSVPCSDEAVADVGSVVAKAKKASAYLWILLHAQVGEYIHSLIFVV